jgi:DNA invertase Pin-like site-specific DNA recombinase
MLHLMPKVIKPIVTKTARHPARGQRVGYVRVSTFEQNENRQLDGIELDRTFTDKVSGKSLHRPELNVMLKFVREGDTVICHSMDRLGRNLDDLRKLVLGMTERGIQVQFVKESLTFTGEDSPMANLLLSVMGAFAQFERELIRERQREGIELAKKAGVYTGRRRVLNAERAEELVRRLAAGEGKSALARELGVDRRTIYRYEARFPKPAAKKTTRTRTSGSDVR